MALKIKMKKLDKRAVMPTYANNGDAGMDLTATSKWMDDEHNIVYSTGIALQIPKGYAGFLFPRSSVSKKNLSLANSVGIIDSTYRGEIMVKFKKVRRSSIYSYPEYNIGDRVCQLVILPYPEVTMHEVDELTMTKRGSGGFGSTGK